MDKTLLVSNIPWDTDQFNTGMLSRSTSGPMTSDADRFQQTFERASVGIFQTTPSGRFLRVNPRLTKLLGYNSPRALTAAVSNIASDFYVDPDRRAAFMRILEANGAIMNFESQVYRHNGQIIWISENAWEVRNAAGVVVCYEGLVEDITPRKQAENLNDHARTTAADREAAPEIQPMHPPTDHMSCPFHLESLLQSCLGDTTFCAMILQKFVNRWQDQWAALTRAANAGNAVDLSREAHSLSGVAANLSAEDLKLRAAELERVARAGDFHQVEPLLERVHAELKRCVHALPQALARLGE